MIISYKLARDKVLMYSQKMAGDNLVIGTWGNISCRVDGTDLVAITPSGVSYGDLSSDDIVIVDMEGNTVDGDLKPSIELGLHLKIFAARQDVSAIVHTHSTYVTAHAIARKGIPAAAEDLAQIVGGDVEVSEYRLPGTPELGDSAVRALGDRNAVIMANHGLVGVGRSLAEAYKVVNIVEKAAMSNVFANILGGVVRLSDEDIDIMRDFYTNKYGQRDE